MIWRMVTYAVMLSGGTTNTDFRGFIIQARTMADDSPVGEFMAGSNSQPQCTNDVCIGV